MQQSLRDLLHTPNSVQVSLSEPAPRPGAGLSASHFPMLSTIRSPGLTARLGSSTALGICMHHVWRGFTLIELLVVIAIIGLLASVVITSLGRTRVRARDSRRAQDLHTIQTALELYASDNNHYPNSNGTWASFDAPAYINNPIVNPNATNLSAALQPYLSSPPRIRLQASATTAISISVTAHRTASLCGRAGRHAQLRVAPDTDDPEPLSEHQRQRPVPERLEPSRAERDFYRHRIVRERVLIGIPSHPLIHTRNAQHSLSRGCIIFTYARRRRVLREHHNVRERPVRVADSCHKLPYQCSDHAAGRHGRRANRDRGQSVHRSRRSVGRRGGHPRLCSRAGVLSPASADRHQPARHRTHHRAHRARKAARYRQKHSQPSSPTSSNRSAAASRRSIRPRQPFRNKSPPQAIRRATTSPPPRSASTSFRTQRSTSRRSPAARSRARRLPVRSQTRSTPHSPR